jgi:hypothetical protein
MTGDTQKSTTQMQQQKTIASSTWNISDLAENAIPEEFLGSRPTESDQSPTATSPKSATPSNTDTAPEADPSLADAISTPFVDVRTIGLETWPINGLRTWEGKIVEVDGDYFTAELTPTNVEGSPAVLRSDFRSDNLQSSDHVVAVGDLFYLTARKVRTKGRIRTSYSFQLRRTGSWTEAELAQVRARTQARLRMLNENVE